jgi:hypothetical protein
MKILPATVSNLGSSPASAHAGSGDGLLMALISRAILIMSGNADWLMQGIDHWFCMF